MNKTLTATLALVLGAALHAAAGPFDGKTFKGRIAWSADGNYNDEDDWAASPVALAIFAEFGVQSRLVHFDYNCILPKTNAKWEKEHEISVLGAAQRYGYKNSIFHDCRHNLDRAINSITSAINASSADDPLYFILAGPMEVPYRGIEKSDPAKRKHVWCISHSRWNDGYSSGDLVKHNKRHVIAGGVHWVQIKDQNQFLATSPFGRPAKAEEWAPWQWLHDSKHGQVRFLWDRLRATTRADCSDAGMAYFLMTGDEDTHIAKLRKLLDEKSRPQPISVRKRVRLEAENFRVLENYDVENINDRGASHRLGVKLTKSGAGRIRTSFQEPYTAARGRYDVDVRYFAAKGHRNQIKLLVNDVAQSAFATAPDKQGWQTHAVLNVAIQNGDAIAVEVQAAGDDDGKLDYVELHYRGPGK